MPQIEDIRVYKTELRNKCKEIRLNMSDDEKLTKNRKIFQRLITLRGFIECDTVFCYVSTPIEVDTRHFIEYALKKGKTVAVPRCVPNTRLMEFYSITSLEDLQKGAFSVDEPLPDKKRLVADSENSICIVPGLCFDKSGFRLGYGKGYYDRYLSKYSGSIVGICYSDCITDKLITGRFDRKSDIIVTDKGFITPKNQKKRNG